MNDLNSNINDTNNNNNGQRIDHMRLGAERRNVRDYAVHQRPAGLDAGGRILEMTALESGCALFCAALLICCEENFISELVNIDSLPGIIFLASFCMFAVAAELRTPRLIAPPTIPNLDVNFNHYEGNDGEFYGLYGFSLTDARELHDALGIPDHYTLNEGSHSFKMCGEHAFLYTLFRLRSPSQRQTLDTPRFGYDYSVLSKAFNKVCEDLDARHGHRLRQLPHIAHKLALFNERIRHKIATTYPNLPMPEDAEGCALFVDGTRLRVSRPAGAWWRQYAYFSGDKWYHCHGAQGVFGPDGMFYDWYDGPVGRRNDKFFFRDSGVNSILRDSQLGHEPQYYAYGDKGYTEASHLRVAAHGPGQLTAQEAQDNWIMAKERVGIEWGYAKVKARCPFLKQAHLMKLQGCNVALYVRVAVLLTNCHTCLHQSQTGLYFMCEAPSLDDYLA